MTGTSDTVLPDWCRLGARVVGASRRGIITVGGIKGIDGDRGMVLVEDGEDERERWLPLSDIRPLYPREYAWTARYDADVLVDVGRDWPRVAVTRWEENGLGERRNEDVGSTHPRPTDPPVPRAKVA